MLLLERLLVTLLFPISLCLIILAIGLYLLWFTSRQRAGKVVSTVAFVLLFALSNNWISSALLRPFERKYQPLAFATADVFRNSSADSAKWIVVLGEGHISDERLPLTSRLSDDSFRCVTEAVKLHRRTPGSKLLLSGGKVFDRRPEAEGMSLMAKALGVNGADIVLEIDSHNTEEQARRLQQFVGTESFLLVCSAWHMPRAMALFAKQGMTPIPAPVNFLIKEEVGLTPRNLLPGSWGVLKSEKVVYEHAAMLWLKLRGEI